MADGASMTRHGAGIEKALEGMIARGKSPASYLDRIVYREYQNAQRDRFRTINSSEGQSWDSLTETYAMYKKKKFASSPGSGNLMMIATDRLRKSVTGEDPSGIGKVATNSSLKIRINLDHTPYAGFAGNRRPFMEFSNQTTDKWLMGVRDYVAKGKG